jgi:ABC-type antimicrobial peptide transport system permease subunit
LRVALGASGGRVVIPVIARPLLQIGVGIVVGASLVVLTFVGMFSSAPTPGEAAMIAAYVVLMLTVSLLACAVPTRRALRLEPSQVLRAEA